MPYARVQQHELELPYAFHELDIPSRNKAFWGGRGSAKSHTFAQKLVLKGRQRPLRILCARELQKSISQSVKQLLDDKISATGLDGFYESTERTIKGRNGTQFAFAGLRSNPDSVKSFEGIDIAWVEEANSVSQSSLDFLTPTVRKPGSELWYSWNPRHETDPVHKMFLGGEPPPRSIVRGVNWNDNPWFPDVLREEMEWDKRRDYDKYLHVWEGHTVIRGEAKVFHNWIMEDIDDHVPENCIPRLGADWGFAIDPTVLVECYVWDRILYFRREAWKLKCSIDETPALFAGSDEREPAKWANLFSHQGIPSVREGFPIIADSSRPETIKYMRDRHFNIHGSRKGAGSVEDGVEFMNSYDIVIHPDCVHVADEIQNYSFAEDPHTGEILPILRDKDNHTIDACRYSLEALRRSRRARVPQAPQTVQLRG